jgi:hypothetical protein
MPRLLDLLSFMALPGVEHVWLLLDIKVGYVPIYISPAVLIMAIPGGRQ